ncbi:MCM5 [Enterospora canceri]|uniref:DNA replication licensing factor MCM5 n=1 Tax=Enterospora canceri TaxID=1081671 RepID=A0A1Y1S774_9MICR|nr:MCM5 [Enterospora canceri]
MSYDKIQVTSIDLLNQDNPVTRDTVKQLFLDFIRHFRNESTCYYANLFNGTSLVVRLEHINAFSPVLYNELQKNPLETASAFEEAASAEKGGPAGVELISSQNAVAIRDIKGVRANRIVRMRGIVVSAASPEVRPTELLIECRSCSETQRVTDFVPRRCSNRNGKECPTDPFLVVTEKSKGVDSQLIKVQEEFEETPAGETPRHLSVVMEGVLVNRALPGRPLSVTGVVCVRTSRRNESWTVLHCLGIEEESRTRRAAFSEEERAHFLRLSKSGGIGQRVANSVAPGIYGMEDVKKAIACQLFGGVAKRGGDGIRLRGEMNVLLLGDPGIAKSQLLKFAEAASPIGVYASGKGSSAAGLTAAVIRDRGGGFRLEGGALVLADGGICCIDEFDKMGETDRVAIHEAMEQQTVSISKAGITTVLKTRSAVLAAANPAFGRFDDHRSVAENVDFGSTILSRFDLIFILRDEHSEGDRKRAQFVLEQHCRRQKKVDDSTMTVAELRDYVSFCRANCSPILSQGASRMLGSFYVEARSSVAAGGSVVPITVRQLEAIIRVSEALARMEMGAQVSVEHVEEAIRLFQGSTMNAVSSGHRVEGMGRRRAGVGVMKAVDRIIAMVPVGGSRRVKEVIDQIDMDEGVVKQAIDYLVKKNRIIEKEHGRMIIRERY